MNACECIAMPRRIERPRIILLDCPLEYKKGENQTHVDIKGEGDFEAILKAEEEYVENQCKDIIKLRPNLVFTEKGVSDLAAFYLGKAGISVVRRLRSMDNGRIARAVGARVVNETSLLTETDVGTGMYTIILISLTSSPQLIIELTLCIFNGI
jgi:T-complex protein 1 subunit gamma